MGFSFVLLLLFVRNFSRNMDGGLIFLPRPHQSFLTPLPIRFPSGMRVSVRGFFGASLRSHASAEAKEVCAGAYIRLNLIHIVPVYLEAPVQRSDSTRQEGRKKGGRRCRRLKGKGNDFAGWIRVD